MRARVFLAFLAASVAGVAASAMEWPLPDATVVRNFGFNDRGRPAVGVVLAGGGEVLASGDGEVIFTSSGSNGGASRFPSPLGEWTAVDHGNGLVSVYARYRARYRARYGASGPRVSQGEPLAVAGASGWSDREGCYFMLFDRRERRWVNPAMVLAPFPDALNPQIHGVQLMNEAGVLVGVGQGVAQGMHGIVVNATDALSGNRGSFLAPHRIISSVNGIEVGRLSLETISARDGVLLVNRGPARSVYAQFPAFEAGEVWLNRGQAILEVIVQDIAGNSSSVVAHFFVE
ncbi:MAG: peptidoglycan DD-metalloendopeptidase family protein [Treponema sp.]|nr:peptidoglycan DD-metalloendopeptidase family protein [Treponema sp.]